MVSKIKFLAISIITVLFSFFSFSVLASTNFSKESPGILPSSLWYSFDLAFERIQDVFTFSTKAKMKTNSQIIAERFAELNVAFSADKSNTKVTNRAFSKLKTRLVSFQSLVNNIDPNDKDLQNLVEILDKIVLNQQAQMQLTLTSRGDLKKNATLMELEPLLGDFHSTLMVRTSEQYKVHKKAGDIRGDYENFRIQARQNNIEIPMSVTEKVEQSLISAERKSSNDNTSFENEYALEAQQYLLFARQSLSRVKSLNSRIINQQELFDKLCGLRKNLDDQTSNRASRCDELQSEIVDLQKEQKEMTQNLFK